MKLVMTLLVRDEEDVIDANIRFHLAQGVDYVIAMDNLSTDGTRTVLESYQDMGVLQYLSQTEDNYDQSRWVTSMSELARVEHDADWVICSDADEFWWPTSGSLRDAFLKIPLEAEAVKANRHNFVPQPGPGAFYERMTVRERISLNNLGRPLPGKVAHRALPGVAVDQGNHSLRGLTGRIDPLDVDILHFPVRSLAQIENKIAKGGAAYMRNERLPEQVGLTWRTLYREMNDKGSLKDYFDKCCGSDDDTNHRMMSGELVRDERLRDYLRELESDTRSYQSN